MTIKVSETSPDYKHDDDKTNYATTGTEFSFSENIPIAVAVSTPVMTGGSGDETPECLAATNTIKASSKPPPGVENGGEWGTYKYIGGCTITTCTVVSVVCCLMTLLPCGLFALACPADTKDAYRVRGKVYDHKGKFIGNDSNKFKPSPYFRNEDGGTNVKQENNRNTMNVKN